MHNRSLVGLSLLVLCALFVSPMGCGGKDKDEDTTATKVKKKKKKSGGGSGEFGAFAKARTNPKLPLVVGKNVDSNLSCFKQNEWIEPADANIEIKDVVDRNKRTIKKSVVKWIFDTLEPHSVNRSFADQWNIEFDELVVVEMTPDIVRFTENPACLESDGWLPKGQQLATVLIGAKFMKFTTTLPLDEEAKASLVEAAGMANIAVESESLFEYVQAKNSSGEPMTDKDNNPMFTSPSGIPIPEKEVPSESARGMKEWTFKMEEPVYFAYKAFPKEAVRMEMKKDKCNVVLIPGDQSFAKPDCAEFQEVGFAIEKKGKKWGIKISTGEKEQEVRVPVKFKKVKRIMLNDRIIVWMMAKKVEVGIQIFVNSLVIDPKPLSDAEVGGYDSYASTTPISRDEPDEEETEVEEMETEEDKEKKRLKSSDNALDQYLVD